MKELSLVNCRLDKRYDVRDELGRGSYAEIFLSRDILASPQSPHSSVVIKALNVFLQDDLDADLERTLVENFQNEAVALDRVRHPNIISRIGHGTARDLRGTVFHYLVLEYLAGGDLQAAVRRARIPLKRSMNYIEQICSGLGHAHSRGVIHRDIKPQNLLLTADHETVKIADFGVARFSFAETPITRVGTNIYAPPEHSPLTVVAGDEPAAIRLTPASDIYSLAKSVYTIVTGEAPRAFANNAITSIPADFRDEDWADEFVGVINRATHSDPALRPQTVEEFWTDLGHVRQIIDDDEISTLVRRRSGVPQPHVARGYTPIVPEQPRFDAEPITVNTAAPRSEMMQPAVAARPTQPSINLSPTIMANIETQPRMLERSQTAVPVEIAPVKKKRRFIRGLAVFAIFLIIFTGILYGTHAYMQRAGIWQGIVNTFRTQTGVANSDVFLRQGPGTDFDQIGVVTKNSKVKIVNSQNNWYQVDVVEQGRPQNGGPTLTRGWLNGKFLDVDPN